MKYYFLTITGIKDGRKHHKNITFNTEKPFFSTEWIKSELGFEILIVDFFQEITEEQWEYYNKQFEK